MYGLTLAVLCARMAADPVELPGDVSEIDSRRFALPVVLTDEQRGEYKKLRLLVSDDRGRSWREEGEYEPTAEQLEFEAAEDGLYWFAAQVVTNDGGVVPADPKDLRPQRKVFINTSGRPVKVRKPYPELVRENAELRKKVQELEKRLADREPGRKPR